MNLSTTECFGSQVSLNNRAGVICSLSTRSELGWSGDPDERIARVGWYDDETYNWVPVHRLSTKAPTPEAMK